MVKSIIQGLLFFGLVFHLSCKEYSQDSDATSWNEQPFQIGKEEVCMVDNKLIKDTLMLQIELDGKKYYGCCDPCIEYLRLDDSIRFAIDPYSKKRISKADAFLALKKTSNTEVLYFESERNYKLFRNNQ